MLETFDAKRELDYEKIPIEEQKQRGILGRLAGIIADFKRGTRNTNLYNEELWEKRFKDPIVKEKIENKCFFGELGHPAERAEVDPEKIAWCLAEVPKKGTDGFLYGVFDILATPSGKILKTLCDYGCKIGASSRGEGDTSEDYEGNNVVDPNSYSLECWDAVLLPAVKAARLTPITESLDSRKNLKQALTEELDASSDDDRKKMEEVLDKLNIDLESDDTVKQNEPDVKKVEDTTSTDSDTVVEDTKTVDEPVIQNNSPEGVENIVTTEEPLAATDSGADVLAELQEALKQQQELDKQVKSLQEKLSVCYTKEVLSSETISRMSSEIAEAKTKYESVVKERDKLKESVSGFNKTIESQKKKISAVSKYLNESRKTKESLTESFHTKDSTISKLEDQVSKLNEALVSQKSDIESREKQLTESLEDSKKDLRIVQSQSNAKIAKARDLVEKYKKIAKTAIDKYIGIQSTRLGVSAEQIRSKLTESYSFKDIDQVCESLQRYKITANALPFNIADKKPVKVQITESKSMSKLATDYSEFDDDIDETLKSIL